MKLEVNSRDEIMNQVFNSAEEAMEYKLSLRKTNITLRTLGLYMRTHRNNGHYCIRIVKLK